MSASTASAGHWHPSLSSNMKLADHKALNIVEVPVALLVGIMESSPSCKPLLFF